MSLSCFVWRTSEGDECSVYPVRVTSPRLPLALLIAASAFALTGCSPEAAVPSAPPSAEAEPLFASDEEALAAAEAAYAEYLSLTNQILQDGGQGGEAIEPLVSEAVLADELEGFEYWLENEWRSVGGTELESASLQQVSQLESGAEVIAFMCLSYESVDVLDSAGESQVPSDRPPLATYEAVLVFEGLDSWKLERNEYWETPESCEQ